MSDARTLSIISTHISMPSHDRRAIHLRVAPAVLPRQLWVDQGPILRGDLLLAVHGVAPSRGVPPVLPKRACQEPRAASRSITVLPISFSPFTASLKPSW